jgi:hypothetical protein
MTKFKRVTLTGSDELFRPTARPRVVDDEVVVDHLADVITEVEQGHRVRVSFTPDEVELLLEAIHAAKYPDRAKRPLPLEKFERFDALRDRLQLERNS